MTLLKCHGWGDFDPCGFASENASEYQAHLMGHYTTRMLAWTCPCGRFGEGSATPPAHTTPSGAPCAQNLRRPMLEALIKCFNAVTNANAFPPVSIGLTPGQFQQLREELKEGGATLKSMWREDEHAVTLYLPAGALLARMEEA